MLPAAARCLRPERARGRLARGQPRPSPKARSSTSSTRATGSASVSSARPWSAWRNRRQAHGQDHRHRPGHDQLGGGGHGRRRADRHPVVGGRAADPFGGGGQPQDAASAWSARWPGGRRSSTPRTRSSRSSASWGASTPTPRCRRRLELVPYKVSAAPQRRRARASWAASEYSPPEDLGHDPGEAQGRRRGLSGRSRSPRR